MKSGPKGLGNLGHLHGCPKPRARSRAQVLALFCSFLCGLGKAFLCSKPASPFVEGGTLLWLQCSLFFFFFLHPGYCELLNLSPPLAGRAASMTMSCRLSEPLPCGWSLHNSGG